MILNRKWILPALSFVAVVSAGLLTYANEVEKANTTSVIAAFALEHKGTLAVTVLAITTLGGFVEFLRALLSGKTESRETLQRVLNRFSLREFGKRGRKNRLTLLRLTSGWGAMWHVANRLPLGAGRVKWRAAMRISPRYQYLRVYLRSVDARSQKSATVLRVGDQEKHCEGVAGRVWEDQFFFVGELPKISPDSVRNIDSLVGMPAAHPVVQYAMATNMTDLVVLKSMGNFGRHFMGSVIRSNDGSSWGVLLLDSEDQKCPFNLNEGGLFKDRFEELALNLGMIVQ